MAARSYPKIKSVTEKYVIFDNGDKYDKFREIYSCKYDRFFRLPVTYAYLHSAMSDRSTLVFSKGFNRMLEDFEHKNKCVISRLLRKALTYNIYLSKKHPNYISFREKKGMLSFSPPGKYPEIDPNTKLWKREGRQEMRPAALVRKLLNPRLVRKLNDKHFNHFATLFKAEEEKTKVTFEYVPFEVGYGSGNTVDGLTSCMVNQPIQNFYNNFDCKLLVARTGEEKKIVGRAIVWNSVSLMSSKDNTLIEEIKYMDRIYMSAPEFGAMFIEYAKDHGMYYRGTCSNSERSIGVYDCAGKELNDIYLTVSIEKQDEVNNQCKFYPYLDTFAYSSREKLYSYNFDQQKNHPLRFKMWNTNGARYDNGYEPGYLVCCEDNAYYPPETLIKYGEQYYKKGGRYCRPILGDTDNQEIVYNRNYTLLYSYQKEYLGRNSDRGKLWDFCAHTGNAYTIDSLVKCYRKGTDEQIMVYKDYALLKEYFSMEPEKKPESVKQPFKYTIRVNNGDSFTTFDSKYSSLDDDSVYDSFVEGAQTVLQQISL